MNKVLLEVADIDKGTIVGLWYLPDNVVTPYVTWISKIVWYCRGFGWRLPRGTEGV